jgi:hypothetical protein
MSNLAIDPTEWLQELFEFEYCSECLLDWDAHTAIPFMGNWFARCDYPTENERELATRSRTHTLDRVFYIP